MPFSKGNTYGKTGRKKGSTNKRPKKKDREYIRAWTIEEFQVLVARHHTRSDEEQEKFWFKVAGLPWLFDRPKQQNELPQQLTVTLDLGHSGESIIAPVQRQITDDSYVPYEEVKEQAETKT